MRNESSSLDLGLLFLRLGAAGMLLAPHGWGYSFDGWWRRRKQR